MHSPSQQLAPDAWREFAAAALNALIARVPAPLTDGYRMRFDIVTAEAAGYADALEREYVKRFGADL